MGYFGWTLRPVMRFRIRVDLPNIHDRSFNSLWLPFLHENHWSASATFEIAQAGVKNVSQQACPSKVFNMSVKAGVWIDHQQAILILVTDNHRELKRISSGIEGHGRAGANNAYTPNDYVSEDSRERKFNSQLKVFYDEVIIALQGTAALLILGPGEAKAEFHKRVKSKKLSGLAIEVETSDKMTDPQLAAKVVRHFTTV